MNLKFATAPCSWGIEDPGNRSNPPWSTILDEAGQSGFKALELGPFGYLPTDPVLLADHLKIRGLDLVAGTIYDNLTSEGDIRSLIEKTRGICSLMSAINKEADKGYLVIIDSVKKQRNSSAGHSEQAVRLPVSEWKKMMETIKTLSKIAAEEYGLRPVIHPHAGGYIEFKDETERFLSDISEEIAGLCLDTGHLYYAGENPSESLIKYSSRLDYVHFKDINEGLYRNALKETMGFFHACSLGVMCSIGTGCIDYKSVFNALESIEYKGWVTIEQERDPKESGGALADLMKSYDFLINASIN